MQRLVRGLGLRGSGLGTAGSGTSLNRSLIRPLLWPPTPQGSLGFKLSGLPGQWFQAS